MGGFNQSVHSKGTFITAPYRLRGNNQFAPSRPDRCNAGCSDTCYINTKCQRMRKCGPPFPLIQFFCKTHKVTFTVYPPGWTPYGRKAVVPLSEDGYPEDNWDKTYFAACLQMSQGVRWPEGGLQALGVRRTQGRHINSFCKLFSLDAIDYDVQHQVALALNVDTLKIISLANGIREGPSLKNKAKGVRAILRSLTAETDESLQNIIQLGHKHGFWGSPLTKNCG